MKHSIHIVSTTLTIRTYFKVLIMIFCVMLLYQAGKKICNEEFGNFCSSLRVILLSQWHVYGKSEMRGDELRKSEG
jgi:hypothetical protein